MGVEDSFYEESPTQQELDTQSPQSYEDDEYNTQNDLSSQVSPSRNLQHPIFTPDDPNQTLISKHQASVERTNPPQRSQQIQDRSKMTPSTQSQLTTTTAFHVASTLIGSTNKDDAILLSEVFIALIADSNIPTEENNDIDAPGSDPAPFLPEPRSMREVMRLPPRIKLPWVKAFVKELRGLIFHHQAVEIDEPLPSDKIIPALEVLKCKIEEHGLLDKLKVRIVFRGDLYKPTVEIDPWNPHAIFLSIKYFLAWCAERSVYPGKADMVMAYLQARMRDRVFIKFPDYWKYFLPQEYHKYIGCPLRLLKALYGYTFSGKFLYEEQADFLREQGFVPIESMPALWIKRLQNSEILLLQYSDDFMYAGTCTIAIQNFLDALKSRFEVEISQRATWYLQARIHQDSEGNITLDQSRYARSIIERYLPNAPLETSPEDLITYASPLPSEFKFTANDNSPDTEAVITLEREFGFHMIELAGSLNYLAHTVFEELFAIRKICRFTRLPGRPHFRAALHLLHHLRCHPPQAIKFYRNPSHSPLTQMLRDIGLSHLDPSSLIYFCDSAFGDCDGLR